MKGERNSSKGIKKKRSSNSTTMVKTLLVVDFASNWFQIFGKNARLPSGEAVRVEQCEWKDISLRTAVGGRATLRLARSESPQALGNQSEERTVSPDFLLVRNFPASGLHGETFENVLIGLIAAGLPAVNSLESILADTHRPLQHAQLIRCERTLKEHFPFVSVVPMSFVANQGAAVSIASDDERQHFPAVVKVSSTHAGFGKAVARTRQELDDIVSIVALGRSYFTVEPFVGDIEFEYRIQRIGASHTRVFRRSSDSGWKSNWGDIRFELLPTLPHHTAWADEAQKMHGGLDIFALDVLHLRDGREVVLEINATACGLMWEHEQEDNRLIADLVLAKMASVFC